jgi:hypothetical protein
MWFNIDAHHILFHQRMQRNASSAKWGKTQQSHTRGNSGNSEIIDGIIGERHKGIDAKKLGCPFPPKTNSGMMQMQKQMSRHFNSSCGAPGMKARRNM